MRPEEHWQIGVDQIKQIEGFLAADPRHRIDRDLYRLAKLHLLAAHGGAQLQQHYPGRFAELMARNGDQGWRNADSDAFPGVVDTPGFEAHMREARDSFLQSRGGDRGDETGSPA